MNSTGSRGWKYIDFSATCTISGLDSQNSSHKVLNISGTPTLILRKDLVDYCLEFLAFKMGFTGQVADIALHWSEDEWRYHSNKVYRKSLDEDYNAVSNVIRSFKDTYNLANDQQKKISY